MSKASQRRLAEQQKKNKKLGIPKRADVRQVLDLGPDAILDAPLSFWKCMAAMRTPRKKHPEDDQLEAFFKTSQQQIEHIHEAAITSIELGGEATPGIAIHGYISGDDIDHQIMSPFSVIRCEQFKDADHLFEKLNQDRMDCELEYEASILIFALPLPGDPLVCLGSTNGGARFVRLRVEGQWIVCNDDKTIPTIAIDEIERFADLDGSTGLRALSVVLKAIGTLFDLGPDELNDKLTPEVRNEISKGLDIAATPYFQLAIGAAAYADITNETVTSTAQEERERAKQLESLHRKATSELSTVKKQLASTLNEQKRRSVSPPPPQEKPQAITGSTKAHVPSALANRLAAFF